MSDLPATPTSSSASIKHSPSSSSAASTTAPSSPATAGGFSDVQMEQLKALIQPLSDNQYKLSDKLSDVQKSMSKVQKTLGLLVEDKARQMACRQFGENFSRPFKIKSIYDLVKLIANANTILLKKDDYNNRTKKVNELVEILEKLLPSFYKRAIRSVFEVVDKNSAFANEFFAPIKAEFQKKVIDTLNLDEVDWEKKFGLTVGILSKLTEKAGSEIATVKKLISPFKRKLERLKVTASGDLTSCNSAGIMLLSALADGGEVVWRKTDEDKCTWIANNINVFDFKEEIECDFTPMISVVQKHATIKVGEIKTSINRYTEAKQQMIYMVNLLHLGLWFVIGGPFHSVVKIGHLFVIEAEENDQRFAGKVDDGISMFVYKSC
mmetsp:Transcript_1531/g.1626  ORF Transcript_1531/g.1626 Transcript_1531/m.1626 type:complete len:380 (+) Transcript_1531:254-1393(+)